MQACGPNYTEVSAVFVGFDSAWADNPIAPGAICAVEFDGAEFVGFRAPELVGFDKAAEFVEAVRRPDRPTIVAIDQPTIVRNTRGMRPADRVAASVVSWIGGGVQPANTGRVAFFGKDAKVWSFLASIGAVLDPEAARTAASGVHAVEVFPALALASLDAGFFGRLKGPRYNPARKTFKLDHWNAAVAATRAEAASFGLDGLVDWLDGSFRTDRPPKRQQDALDSTICLLAGLRWRLRPRADSVMVGDLLAGHIVAPASPAVRERLMAAARRVGAPLDGTVPAIPTRLTEEGLAPFAV
jgi:predicted RNase H-like nuclease